MAIESRALVVLAPIANGIIAVGKTVAAGISASTAMLADGFHLVADSVNQVVQRFKGEVQAAMPEAPGVLIDLECAP